MSEKRFQKTRIVDKWGGIYDSETDEVLDVNDVEHKLNEQQSTISRLEEENEQLKKQLEIRTESDKYHQRMLMKWLCKDDGDGV